MAQRASRGVVVDDSAFMRKLLSDMLIRAGFDVGGTAGDGESAVEVCQQVRPDFILLDLSLPGMLQGGLEALRALQIVRPEASVIATASPGQESLVAEAITCGVADFMVKPYQPERVEEAVRRVLNLRDRCAPGNETMDEAEEYAQNRAGGDPDDS